MIISTEALKSLRQQRGWSQQHLADASGLSLRTIQRLEKEGRAGNETVQSICATFNIAPSDLSIIPKVNPTKENIQKTSNIWLAFGIFLAGAIAGGLATYIIF